jgi:hypothetical protein
MHRLLFIAWNQQELLERNYFNKNDSNGAVHKELSHEEKWWMRQASSPTKCELNETVKPNPVISLSSFMCFHLNISRLLGNRGAPCK